MVIIAMMRVTIMMIINKVVMYMAVVFVMTRMKMIMTIIIHGIVCDDELYYLLQ